MFVNKANKSAATAAALNSLRALCEKHTCVPYIACFIVTKYSSVAKLCLLHQMAFVLCCGAEYAQVTKMLGNGRLEAMCFDGTKRLCHIRGKLRKKARFSC